MKTCKIPANMVLAAFLLASTCAGAQNYPSRFVRIISGTPGAFPDIVARHVAQWLAEKWKQPVVVENHANIAIGASIAANSPPDGYTLFLADRTALSVNPSLYRDLPYDPARDFSPISLVASTPMLLVVHPSIPANSVKEFLDFARKQPQSIAYGSAGNGTATHLAGEMMKQVTGAELLAVHYKGAGAAMLALLRGEVQAEFNQPPIAMQHIKAGKAKALVITSRKRFAGAPDIETVAEAGYPELEAEFWLGLVAPARTPAPLIARLNHDVVEILKTSVAQSTLLTQGAEPIPGTTEEFQAFMRSETVKLKKVIETAGIKAD